MDKKQIRNWLDDANAKGLISDEKYEQYFRELNSTENPAEFWKSIRGEVSGLGGAVNIDKTYKSEVDLTDMVEKEIPNIDYEELTPANKRDIAKNLNISVEDVDRAINTLWHRDLDKAIEEGDIEQKNRQISNQYKRAQEIKESPAKKHLGNQYAIRRYIEGAPDWEVALNEGLGIAGEASEFVPTSLTPVGIVAPIVDPLIQAGQRYAYRDENYSLPEEALKTGKQALRNYLTGIVGGKAGRKVLGDLVANKLGLSGKQAKALGDKVEEYSEKIPGSDKLATYSLRNILADGSSDEGQKAIKVAEKEFDDAVKETQKRYAKRWDNDEMIPTSEDSEVMQEAYRRYKETRGE